MFKKILFIYLIAINIMILSSCHYDYENKDVNSFKNDNNYEKTLLSNSEELQYETLMLEEDNITISYPKISGISKNQDLLNELIYNKAKSIIGKNKDKEISRINFNIAYYDREMLSILFYSTIKNNQDEEIEFIEDFNFDLVKNITIDFKNYFGGYDDNLINKIKTLLNIDVKGDERIYFTKNENEKYVVIYFKNTPNDTKYERKYFSDEKIKKEILGQFK